MSEIEQVLLFAQKFEKKHEEETPEEFEEWLNT